VDPPKQSVIATPQRLVDASKAMARPSDRREEGDVPSGIPEGHGGIAMKVPMIDPGFREVPAGADRPVRILGITPPANPKDRKNLLFLGISVLVALVIFALLEIKQQRDLVVEQHHAPNPPAGTN
jgi:hypothetical protein